MQNSGLGNAVNPLISLIAPEVYRIPVLLLIGWRGEPGTKDEPQHQKQGSITLDLLKVLGISYAILSDSPEEVQVTLDKALRHMQVNGEPYALVARKGAFSPYQLKNRSNRYFLKREDAIGYIVSRLREDNVIVSTTGMISRELFECRINRGEEHGKDFLTVGSMGHSSQIALGIALARKEKTVYCLDGDGALIMHMGALAIIGSVSPRNFKHIILNNGSHDSVGGHPSAGFMIDVPAIARSCGYKVATRADTFDELSQALDVLKSSDGPVLLEVRVATGARENLGRPTGTPEENKQRFMALFSRTAP